MLMVLEFMVGLILLDMLLVLIFIVIYFLIMVVNISNNFLELVCLKMRVSKVVLMRNKRVRVIFKVFFWSFLEVFLNFLMFLIFILLLKFCFNSGFILFN